MFFGQTKINFLLISITSLAVSLVLCKVFKEQELL
jgi:hypothetical protein